MCSLAEYGADLHEKYADEIKKDYEGQPPAVVGNYIHVVPDSAYWVSLDQMINYFTQVQNLDRREILVHLENCKKQGYTLTRDKDFGLVRDENGNVKGYTAKELHDSIVKNGVGKGFWGAKMGMSDMIESDRD